MNISDKRRFYGEIFRVLKPGDQLLFHDIFGGNDGTFYYPVPWAKDDSINFLVTPNELKNILVESGFQIEEWKDNSQPSLKWFIKTKEKLQKSGPLPLGFHVLIGDSDLRSPLHIAQKLHSGIPSSKLVVVKGVGHVVNAEAPEKFNTVVREFLASIDS